MRVTNLFVALVTVLCTVAAYTTANAEIEKSTVEKWTIENGRVLIIGKVATSDALVVQYNLGEKPIDSRDYGRGGDFEVVVEASDKIPLEDGKTGHGFVVTTKIGTSKGVQNNHIAKENGTFAIRREADFVTKDGVLTFADITLKDGKMLPVSFRIEQ